MCSAGETSAIPGVENQLEGMGLIHLIIKETVMADFLKIGRKYMYREMLDKFFVAAGNPVPGFRYEADCEEAFDCNRSGN